MEEQKKQDQSEGCQCWLCRGKMTCGNWHWHRFFLLKLLIGIIILVAVFAVGVKVGELKGAFGRGYGYYGRQGRHYMMPSPYYGQPYPQMMQGQGASTGTNPLPLRQPTGQ